MSSVMNLYVHECVPSEFPPSNSHLVFRQHLVFMVSLNNYDGESQVSTLVAHTIIYRILNSIDLAIIIAISKFNFKHYISPKSIDASHNRDATDIRIKPARLIIVYCYILQ